MTKSGKLKSTLNINSGVKQPPSVSDEAVQRFIINKKKQLSINEFVEGILSQNRIILSQAITLIESSLASHYEIAQKIIEKCLPYSGNSIRVGITGIPGVGKSSFIEAIGTNITEKGHKLAVLAIDPSSEKSKGSILGDKTRMENLSVDSNAFIRPSPSAGSLGGVARKTRETIILCEAAGFDVVFVETVGVGQSEIAVHSMVDFFLLLMLAGAGDELQGIKRGIIEMADALVVTKADGTNIENAERAQAQYKNVLHLFPPSESGWITKVLICSSYQKHGIDEVWDTIVQFKEHTIGNNFFQKKRKMQSLYWIYETIDQNLKDNFYRNISIQKMIKALEKNVLEDRISSFIAAKRLLNKYFKDKNPF